MSNCEIRNFVEVNKQKNVETARDGLYERDTKKKIIE